VGRLASARTLRFADSTTPARALAWTFTWYLRQAGYDEVFNLLDAFLRCDPGARWTRGYWNPRPEHVIDLLADRLEAEGIHVPSRARVPRLRADDVANIGRIDILVNADAGNNLKTLPAVRWAEVVQQISLTGLRVALLRGPEAPVARAVQGLLPSIEVVDSRSVDELLVRVATARCILSPDTGVLHIAAALGTPFVGLFGPTDPRFLGPYVTHGGTILHTPEVHEATCRACWLPQMLPVASCGRGYRYGCTAALQPDAIARAVVAAVTERSSPEWREMEPRMASAPDGTEDRAPG
jgi:ADP-heptose:LPS heptosyltransferase